jgi:hypothetical protein
MDETNRSLLFYTLAATLPILILSASLLFTSAGSRTLVGLSILGCITGLVAFGSLLYETALDLAGDSELILPIWSVVYLIIYLISVFTFLFFGMHIGNPGRFFGGFQGEPNGAFIDALYMSLAGYVGIPPDSITLKTQGVRFLTVGQSAVSMLISLVIITKFVSSF